MSLDDLAANLRIGNLRRIVQESARVPTEMWYVAGSPWRVDVSYRDGVYHVDKGEARSLYGAYLYVQRGLTQDVNVTMTLARGLLAAEFGEILENTDNPLRWVWPDGFYVDVREDGMVLVMRPRSGIEVNTTGVSSLMASFEYVRSVREYFNQRSDVVQDAAALRLQGQLKEFSDTLSEDYSNPGLAKALRELADRVSRPKSDARPTVWEHLDEADP